jgi:multidrug resistance protein
LIRDEARRKSTIVVREGRSGSTGRADLHFAAAALMVHGSRTFHAFATCLRSEMTVETSITPAEPKPFPGISRRTLFALALTIFLDFVGFGMILPVMPYYAESLGASATVVTWLSTLFSIAQLVAAPLLGKMSDRFGRRPIILLSIAGSVVTSLMVGLATTLWVLLLARLLSGASKSNFSAAQAVIADVVGPHERARYIGVLGAALGMGFVFGPAIGGQLSAGGNASLPFFAAAGLSVINWIFVFFWLPETRNEEVYAASSNEVRFFSFGKPLPGLQANFRLVLMASLLFFVAFALMESTFALFNARTFGWGGKETGYFLTYIGVIIAAVQGSGVGKMVRRFGEATTLRIGVLFTGIGMVLTAMMPLAQQTGMLQIGDVESGATSVGIACYLFAGFFMAAGNAMCMATSAALVSMMSPADEQGANLGVRESAAAFGRIFGPALAGPLFDRISPSAPLWVAGLVCALNLGFLLKLRLSPTLAATE